MGKAARRSVASDPSSPTLSFLHSSTTSTGAASLSGVSAFASSLSFSRSSSSSSSSSPSSANTSNHPAKAATLQTTPSLVANSDALDPLDATGYFYTSTPDPEDTTPVFSNQSQADWTRERERMEFYATYDVMTGVRIAATLGGFFGLMVFLVIYKSRSRSTTKALKDPTIAAVAAAVVQEEEERELQEAIEATAFSLLQEELNINYPGLKRDRLHSLGNVSAPPTLNRSYRFASVGGGYSSLLNPPRRYSYASSRGHRNSVSVSSRVLSAYNMGDSFGQDDYFLESDGEEADDEFDQYTTTADVGYPTGNYLMVPGRGTESRRSSAMTCCSTESSFLERRCSAITLGLSSLPPMSRSVSRRQSRDDRGHAVGNELTLGATCADWDSFNPGINIIEATPKSSPCPSERVTHTSSGLSAREHSSSKKHPLYDDSSIDCISAYPDTNGADFSSYNQTLLRQSYGSNTRIDDISIANHNPSSNVIVRRAPLASLSSFKMSSADCQDSELRSYGSDSVFDDSCADTDEDLQQFSTDSDELSIPDEAECSVDPAVVTKTGPSTSALSAAEAGQAGLGGASSSSSSCNRMQQQQCCNVALGPASDTIYVDIEKPINDTSCLSSLSNSNRRGKAKLKPDKVNLGTRIETKAIIERQQQNDSRDRSPSPRSCKLAVPQSHESAPTMASGSSLPSNQSSSRSFSHYGKNNNNTSSRKSNYKENDDNSNPVDEKSNNKCVEVNVIIKNHSSTIKSPSVILELPILTIDEESSQSPLSPMDPSVPGPSRKWSKETLF
ncbi:serine-rich adhesin for platelets isoform X2 [Topomyia yanbarensis]|uniref:serine-rich adhesin for platelets isoform X2 n=1 Tax=Topomyia yanbarensis TaxID=2498891 RepID=UPI00273B707B|nr:serine-rich adhesin for platelets isoform X2 [Topomyia yanbarensis]